ncbi:hypothetical protein H5410_001416 [Solanum commersonii]|uniref:Uncharacterized protein n=1 Tax=Solanum commersonii TaxID=4109 RepID=A0A9J6AZL6_SOLCO|nr:hypothetical protein H5410_001416 [Solanum commersonii]
MVKLVERSKVLRDKEKNETIKRQQVWKQSRKEKVMTCRTSEEDINLTAPQPTQESQHEFKHASSSYIPIAEEDPWLRLRTNPQDPIRTRVISFRGDKFGVNEPTNLSILSIDLT